MGQYYMVLTEDKNGKRTVYDRTLNGRYTMAKLMEHSWWENPFVNTICHKIFKKPMKVAWVGDYSDTDGFEFYADVWGESVKTTKLNEAQVCLDNKYLVNHTKKLYLDCNEYYKRSRDKDEWVIHPLPLLTCVGNGNGGGDYDGTDMGYIGTWCMDSVSVELKKPEGYLNITPTFKEGE